jgi:hypothetical protein
MAVLDKNLIDEFQDDGVVLLKGVFNDWIELLRAGVDVNMNEPGPWARSALLLCRWPPGLQYVDSAGSGGH